MDKPKIGVYVCACGINIASKVDVDEVTEFAAELPNVAVARMSRVKMSSKMTSVKES